MFSVISRVIYFSFLFILLLSGFKPVFSQQGTATSLLKKLEQNTKESFQEKIYLHTDKTFYVAGEILWFKIYYVNAINYKPIQVSKVAYVEILNKDGKSELQAKISLEPGQRKGSFYLPVTLNTGNYTIKAYTNWMKNFNHDYFFKKKIIIVNTLKNPDASNRRDSSGFAINFFPEGGNLINDFESKIGFRATDSKGKELDFAGYIINGGGDTVKRFNPFKFGIGSFLFRPHSGETYRAVIVLNDASVVNAALPAAYSAGYVMNLSDNGAGQLRIVVYRKKLGDEEDYQQLLLAGHTRKFLRVAEMAMTGSNDSTVFLVDKMKIGSGITHFTVFNGRNKPVCERLYFKKPDLPTTLNIKSDQEVYTKRQQVNVAVSEPVEIGKNIPFNLSASVYYADNLSSVDELDIVNYMLLTSDLSGKIESPGFYFTDDPAAEIAIDNLMLTHGWRRFNWDELLDENRKSINKYLLEYNGHLLTGRVKDTRNNKPVPDVIAFLSVPGRPFGFYSSKSDSGGWVHFEIKNYYGNGIIIAQPDIQADSFYKVEIMPPFLGLDAADSSRNTSAYSLNSGALDDLLRRSISMQVQNVYSGDRMKSFESPVITDTLPFFGRPELAYVLDNYKRFNTMEEVLREYVRGISVGARKGKLSLKMFNPEAHDFYDGDVLILLDGVPLSDANKIFAYDPLKIRKLDVIQNRYVLGPSIFNGVASFSTYEGMFDGFSLDPALVAIDYDGLQLQREFYSPGYETQEQLEKRIPDFRTTLYWAPDINTGTKGKAIFQFYTSDRPGKYMVVVEGMNDHGEFIVTHTNFEVK